MSIFRVISVSSSLMYCSAIAQSLVYPYFLDVCVWDISNIYRLKWSGTNTESRRRMLFSFFTPLEEVKIFLCEHFVYKRTAFLQGILRIG